MRHTIQQREVLSSYVSGATTPRTLREADTITDNRGRNGAPHPGAHRTLVEAGLIAKPLPRRRVRRWMPTPAGMFWLPYLAAAAVLLWWLVA